MEKGGGIKMKNNASGGFGGVIAITINALLANLTPEALVQWVTVVSSIVVALVTIGMQIYTAVKHRDSNGAEILKGIDVKSLDELIAEWEEKENREAEEKAKADQIADDNEDDGYAPVTLPGEDEES